MSLSLANISHTILFCKIVRPYKLIIINQKCVAIKYVPFSHVYVVTIVQLLKQHWTKSRQIAHIGIRTLRGVYGWSTDCKMRIVKITWHGISSQLLSDNHSCVCILKNMVLLVFKSICMCLFSTCKIRIWNCHT